jgi:hypothetical protein
MAHDAYAGGQAFVSSTIQGADLLLAGFEALSWTEIKPIVSQPGLGVTFAAVEQTYISPPTTQTKSGSAKVNGGDLVCGNITDDPGQVILEGMANARASRAFKFIRNTTLTAGTETDEILYTRGVVLSYGDEGGGADDVINAKYVMAFNQIPVRDIA